MIVYCLLLIKSDSQTFYGVFGTALSRSNAYQHLDVFEMGIKADYIPHLCLYFSLSIGIKVI